MHVRDRITAGGHLAKISVFELVRQETTTAACAPAPLSPTHRAKDGEGHIGKPENMRACNV